MQAGVDPCRELLEVSPMPHSFSGGVRVDRTYRSSLQGFYAVGEAAGGIHGACRCAGNAASQAVISGMLCAEAIAEHGAHQVTLNRRFPCQRRIEVGIFARYKPEIQRIAAQGLAVYRSEEGLRSALAQLSDIQSSQPVRQDEDTQDLCLAVQRMLLAALARRESRGTHLRIDYPQENPAFAHSIVWQKERREKA